MSRFVLEQYYIQKQNLQSFTIISEKQNLTTKQLEFFNMIYESEAYASRLLLKMACKLNLTLEELNEYQPNKITQTQAIVIRQIAESDNILGLAIAFGVNYPLRGAMCYKFKNKLSDLFEWQLNDYAFLDF